ncbi:MAG: hypothetical protein MZU91_09620 [Desulfosudis oleivorans]|nr:hypothetical protein [Desulfosudis oleivorans]
MIVAGIAVDQNDFIAFFAQRLAGLRAGIVELAGLADNDRPGTDEQYFFYVCSFRHFYLPFNFLSSHLR